MFPLILKIFASLCPSSINSSFIPMHSSFSFWITHLTTYVRTHFHTFTHALTFDTFSIWINVLLIYHYFVDQTLKSPFFECFLYKFSRRILKNTWALYIEIKHNNIHHTIFTITIYMYMHVLNARYLTSLSLLSVRVFFLRFFFSDKKSQSICLILLKEFFLLLTQ